MNKPKAQPKEQAEAKKLIAHFTDLFYNQFGVKPEVPYGQTLSILYRLLKTHDYSTLEGVVNLYFQHEQGKVMHLPSILSAWAINKYIPLLAKKNDPRLFVE